MKFIATNEFNEVCFKDDSINIITDEDVLISYEIYSMFFEQQSTGKQFKIKNLQGKTFEEIFEEYQPEIGDSDDQPLSEIDELKQRISELEAIIKSIKVDGDVRLLDAGVVGSIQSTEND